MKKKLKIYTILFVAALILVGLPSVVKYHRIGRFIPMPTQYDKLEYAELPDEYYTFRDTLENGFVSSASQSVIYDVYVERKPISFDSKVLVSSTPNQKYVVDMKKVHLQAPVSHTSKVYNRLMSLIQYVLAIMIVWILVLVIKLIRSILKGEVFVSQVSKYLEKAGVILSVFFIFRWTVKFVIAMYLSHTIELARYYIVFRNDTNCMLILTGLALMIISQIILMGKDLKEEQDLTI